MNKTPSKNRKSFPEFLYHLLIYLYPQSFRQEYGKLMEQAYRELYQEAKKHGGYFGVLLLWKQLLWDFTSSIGWEYLDDYERGSDMKKIVIQELLRALAIGWGTMLLLSIFYKGLGWGSGLVLLIACTIGLLSFVSFTIYRVRSGKELMLQTQRSWVIFGAIAAFGIFAYTVITYNKGASLLDNLFPMLLAFAVLISGTLWGIKQVKKS